MEALDFSLNSLLGILGYLGGIVGVVYTVKSFRENTKVKEGDFLMRKFEGFQQDRQAILDNPRILSILAKAKNVQEDEYILRSINSFRINKAFQLYYLHKKGHIQEDLWRLDEKDIQDLFRDPSIMSYWQKIKGFYSFEFQSFIESSIPQSNSISNK
ncbi:MAG: hypothetical protein AAFR61_25655 [Bacteroidota bacterium]